MENIIKSLLDPEFEDLVHQSRQIGSTMYLFPTFLDISEGELEWVKYKSPGSCTQLSFGQTSLEPPPPPKKIYIYAVASPAPTPVSRLATLSDSHISCS